MGANLMNDESFTEGDAQEDGQTRLSLNFKTALDRQTFNDAVELVMKENNVKKNEAIGIIAALIQKQLAIEGYGAGRPGYANQYYNLIEAQVKNLLTGFRNALENCDEGLLAIQAECNRQTEQLKEELESQKAAHAEAMGELTDYNSQLETGNATLTDENAHLKAENEALSALKGAHDKAAAAWEAEKQALNERIVSLQATAKENAALLKERESLKAEIGALETEAANKEHRFEMALKEAEIKSQQVMADTVTAKVATVEEKSKQYYEPIISDLKTSLAETRKELQEERRNVDAVRIEERAKASEDIKWLQELLSQAHSLAEGGPVAEPKRKGGSKKPSK
jgi:chromosome segregation ATPase